ncbi:MAG: hypothetical protein ACJ74B_08230 [Gaiellaceae bacterium]
MPTAEPLSPELVLVAPPEEAQRAREQLQPPREQLAVAPAAPDAAAERRAEDWDRLLARMREESVAVEAKEPPARRELPKRRRWGRVAAVVAALVVAVLIGVAWAQRDSDQPRLVGPTSASPPTATAPVAGKPIKPPPVRVTPKARPKKPAAARRQAKPATPPERTRPKKSARAPARFVPSRVWSWAPVPGSSRYRVRFFRNGRKVLDLRTTKARLVLPKSFTFHKGRYRWTVVSIAAGKPRRPIVNSTFVLGRE